MANLPNDERLKAMLREMFNCAYAAGQLNSRGRGDAELIQFKAAKAMEKEIAGLFEEVAS